MYERKSHVQKLLAYLSYRKICVIGSISQLMLIYNTFYIM